MACCMLVSVGTGMLPSELSSVCTYEGKFSMRMLGDDKSVPAEGLAAYVRTISHRRHQFASMNNVLHWQEMVVTT